MDKMLPMKSSGGVPYKRNEVRERVGKALAYTEQALAPAEILEKTELAEGIVEFRVHAPLIARAALAGQFVRFFYLRMGNSSRSLWPTGMSVREISTW